ncbi:MAG TPA: hypothetical protein PLT36_01220 [Erysipelotrichaceae bacterium]|jgi:hypothetical protein|nr:hypothetical protein [Erysipelotrichaceae bacterium]HQA84555.1 hypothetical protein [Erysipelotrichaceae bacterium]
MEKVSYVLEKELVAETFQLIEMTNWKATECEKFHIYQFDGLPFDYVGEEADYPNVMASYIAIGREELERGILTKDAEMMMTYWLYRYKNGTFNDAIIDKEELDKDIKWIESQIDVKYDKPKQFFEELIKEKL